LHHLHDNNIHETCFPALCSFCCYERRSRKRRRPRHGYDERARFAKAGAGLAQRSNPQKRGRVYSSRKRPIPVFLAPFLIQSRCSRKRPLTQRNRDVDFGSVSVVRGYNSDGRYSMLIRGHEVLVLPEMRRTIWRYMDFTKLVGIATGHHFESIAATFAARAKSKR
jgi:hypothetical protein